MLKRNLIANYLGQGWAVLVGIIFVPLYIKYLGMEAYGLVGLFTLLSNWMILLDAGMTPTMNREMARFTAGHHTATSIRDLLRSIEIISLSIATFIVISIALASNWLATSWLKTERLPINEVSQAFIIIGFVFVGQISSCDIWIQ
ncbi:hypothetical protein TI04_08500 [Achromatium sp. WMS2]|nr:hypothetical protein TI04_08500 [Achromatium sp. WMS2]